MAKRPNKIGDPPLGKLGIYDADGNLRGHCGPKGTSATARRFGVADAELTKKNGRPCWRGKGDDNER
ncbi:MAG TPA: hypothetical protein VMV59_06975 [Candidatus Dormibacteraeota bacterium]|nr:hypothetical protein [Candidatus Dormibacteraeota bacterium]